MNPTTAYLLDAYGDRYTLDEYGDRVYLPTVHELHFHIETTGRDCDGGHGRESIQYGWGDDTGRLAWNAYVAMSVRHFGWNTDGCQRMIRTTERDGTSVLEYGGPTDEGYSWTRAFSCTESCRNRRTYVYDEYAQAAGY